MSEDPEARATQAIASALDALAGLDQESRSKLLGEHLNTLLNALAPRYRGSDIYQYFQQNKHGLSLLAHIRDTIQLRYSIPGKGEAIELFVSPVAQQWFDDGVMFVQGSARFAGNIALFQDGRLKFGISARFVNEGDVMTRDDFVFVDISELQKRPPESLVSKSLSRNAIAQLRDLLSARQAGEQYYQAFLSEYPWVLGAQYKSIQAHEKLDNVNIPDFSGTRAKDAGRDIFEIKDPFLPLFRGDGEFASAFNDAWNQAERYLDFCRREADYLLRQKGLYFENPHCYLILGYNLNHDQQMRVRAKERLTPSITVYTYNDVLALAENTVAFFEQHFEREEGRA